MGTVYSSASMSLDGYIAYEDDNPGALFDWYEAGDIEVPTAMESLTFHLTAESARYVRRLTSRLGALVVGRRLFDVTDGWRGRHPYDVPVVVATHDRPAGWSYPGSGNFHFVTDGITAAVAVARSLAGDLDVSVAAGEMASQALESGLLDEVRVDLVPVILGSGRPYFTGGDTWRLGDPTTRIEAKRVTHLVYPVHR
ncbi:dihydrofolate reductase [Conyzicola lurida]|uniref:Dihydrofolate reductase n=1 Tax=Conyzicola lurida TaxID=1172621 RepID=A0A841AQV8_9MICO|nr:dihydrofolate reductase family protein [Conyzicola lurida]MBB5843973.1 dihydrofolate reductase [Conyzicola lurida]